MDDGCEGLSIIDINSSNSLLAATAAAFFFDRTGRPRWIVCDLVTGHGAVFVHIFHLEDHFEGCVEHLVQSLLLLGGAHDKALESVLLCGLLNLFVCHALSDLGLVA